MNQTTDYTLEKSKQFDHLYITGRFIIDWLVFQAGWFLLVVTQSRWLGLIIVLGCIGLGWSKVFATGRRHFFLKTLFSGMAFDQLMLLTGIIELRESAAHHAVFLPVWLMALWVLFSTFARSLFCWCKDKWLIATLIGAFAGPLTYWGASQMGAVEIPALDLFAFFYAVFWSTWLGWTSKSSP